MSTLQVRNVVSPDGGVSDNLKPVTASAWVNFNGKDVAVIYDSHNVSSITDNGIGQYNVNFENAFSDANYCCVAGTTFVNMNQSTGVDVPNVNFASVVTGANGNLYDFSSVYFVVFGGQ